MVGRADRGVDEFATGAEAYFDPVSAAPRAARHPEAYLRGAAAGTVGRHFVLHPSKKAAREAAGQPSRVKPEIHEKPTARGQRWHYHDRKQPSIHHMFGPAKNKK